MILYHSLNSFYVHVIPDNLHPWERGVHEYFAYPWDMDWNILLQRKPHSQGRWRWSPYMDWHKTCHLIYIHAEERFRDQKWWLMTPETRLVCKEYEDGSILQGHGRVLDCNHIPFLAPSFGQSDHIKVCNAVVILEFIYHRLHLHKLQKTRSFELYSRLIWRKIPYHEVLYFSCNIVHDFK